MLKHIKMICKLLGANMFLVNFNDHQHHGITFPGKTAYSFMIITN